MLITSITTMAIYKHFLSFSTQTSTTTCTASVVLGVAATKAEPFPSSTRRSQRTSVWPSISARRCSRVRRKPFLNGSWTRRAWADTRAVAEAVEDSTIDRICEENCRRPAPRLGTTTTGRELVSYYGQWNHYGGPQFGQIVRQNAIKLVRFC